MRRWRERLERGVTDQRGQHYDVAFELLDGCICDVEAVFLGKVQFRYVPFKIAKPAYRRLTS